MVNVAKRILETANDVRNIKRDEVMQSVNKDVKHASKTLNENKADIGYRADVVSSEILQSTTKMLFAQTEVYRKSLAEMYEHQSNLIEQSKKMTQETKNYCNQVGEAMARIDKVLVKDFESKLLLLERFVSAMQTLSNLEKDGNLGKIASVFKA
jgi:hypothetical protein